MRPVRRLILLHFLRYPRVIPGPVRCASSSSANQLNKNKPIPDTRIQPKSALFVSGPSAQLAKFVVDPHLDFDGVFERIDQSHAHLRARKRPQNIAPLKKAWLELRELWKKRDEIDAKQHALAAAYRFVNQAAPCVDCLIKCDWFSLWMVPLIDWLIDWSTFASFRFSRRL